MSNKVLITTSGTGSRLGELTKYTNKALVRVGTKPAISHIIEAYPKDTHFVITLGYFGNQVKDFLSLAYPEHHFEYVEVKQYEGVGSSLGRSMLDAKSLLQNPFTFHACDTLVDGPIPLPEKNWIGVYKKGDTANYASWTLREGKLHFKEKGALDADLLHIGLVGIHDFESFWHTLEGLYEADSSNSTLNDCQTLAKMIEQGSEMEVHEFPTWYDIGNPSALQAARSAAGSSPDDLDKAGEAIFVFDDYVIKFFSDNQVAANRAKRGEILKGFVPEMQGLAGNFYRYKFVAGELYSQLVQPNDFKKFLNWVENNFWKQEDEVDEQAFRKTCQSFYKDKTEKRVSQFLEANNLEDVEHKINGEPVPTVKQMLKELDFDWLSDGLQSRFHGDFILDNIIKGPAGFSFIDWRQDFGGLLRGGDRYYDLAKLNHNLTVNHRVINDNLFKLQSSSTGIRVELMRPSMLVDCQNSLHEFLRERGYDVKKVRVLTAIIWLNMAPLHHHPFNLFLYYFGKLHLCRALKA